MKRILNLRNRLVVTSLFAGLLFTASSFTFGLVGDVQLVDDPPQKKEQKVKVTVNVDGKVTKIDTTFNLPDEKMIQVKVDSMLKKMEISGIEPGMKNIVIHRGGKKMNWSSKDNKFPGDEQFDIMIQHGDSGMTKHVRKIIRMGDDGSIISSEDMEGDELLAPPPPPPPPYPSMMFHQQFRSDPFAFDTNDKSIVSYDKKDIGKGLEKITIIRKKQVDHKQMKEIEVTTEVSDDTKK